MILTTRMLYSCIGLLLGLVVALPTFAHHVLGRPAYSLNEDSNTPPSLAVEAQVGNYFVTYMMFPAFPKPGEAGRVNLYATRVDSGKAYDGEVSFSVRDKRWLDSQSFNSEEQLGSQPIDDGVYRQGFMFNKEGAYIIRASFEADGEPYEIDFPLQVGEASPVGTMGAAIGLLAFMLLAANIFQRRRIQRARTQIHLASASSRGVGMKDGGEQQS